MRIVAVAVVIGSLEVSAQVNAAGSPKSDAEASTYTGRMYLEDDPIVRPVMIMGLSRALSWWQTVNGEQSADDCLIGETTYGATAELLTGYIRMDNKRLDQRIMPLFIEAVEVKCKINLEKYRKIPESN